MKKIALLILLISFLGCKKNKDNENLCDKSGVLKNYLGQNDCNWVLESDGVIYEPVNFNDFSFTYTNGQEFNFSYTTVSTLGACLNGTPVQLTCLEEK